MWALFKRFWKNEPGISSVEYALLLAFIGAAIAMAAAQLSSVTAGKLDQATTSVSNVDAGGGGSQADGAPGDGGSGAKGKGKGKSKKKKNGKD